MIMSTIFNYLEQLDFVIRAIIAGIGIAILAGPLGSIMVWRRLSYLGDTLSHSTLLGVSLALFFNINIYIGLILVCMFVALSLSGLVKVKTLATDAILGIMSHATLAVGLILAAVLPNVKVDLLGLLYGDILAVNAQDIIWIFIICLIVIATVYYLWKEILSVTINSELAQVEGVFVTKINLILIILMSLVFAIAMKLVGVLLITALLIIPASAARQYATHPFQMIIIASLIGITSVLMGIGMSIYANWPTGPAIVAVAASLFTVSLCPKYFTRIFSR